ncbi:Uncharacterized protein conserved in bacteria [Legionella wadsworthii]|uniref:Uncharacterized protein conserved in bacteria n=1 Tax=Legionella wadsworthii TaxID=28088 RepID=A0A378LUT0_9GAMM|nr:poly(ADP-ribose) glycohydrolase domain-containing protein [Legionella wadsworthii]STY31077.1 Uncharacterized protein conserved in bacteria [Legionella wadsworthii]
MWLRFLSRSKPSLPRDAFSQIHEVYAANKPGLIQGSLTGSLWRYRSFNATLQTATTLPKFKELQTTATENFKLWEKTKIDPPNKVEVAQEDFGEVALKLTKKYVRIYSILNNASSYYPGGGVFQGGSAQEENMWHRSTCLLSLLENIVQYDKDYTKSFIYTPEGQELVEGRKKMTEEEQAIYRDHCPVSIHTDYYKTYHSSEPRILFRGPELLIPNPAGEYTSSGFVASPDMSYTFLPPKHVFPFYELRTAAPEHFAESQSKAPSVVKEHKNDLRRRISAQLDTLILVGQPYAVLSAWGCGEFKNEPEFVAEIYGEEIEKRSSFFKHIVFAIVDLPTQSNNFKVFDKMLSGIKLGGASSLRSAPSL